MLFLLQFKLKADAASIYLGQRRSDREMTTRTCRKCEKHRIAHIDVKNKNIDNSVWNVKQAWDRTAYTELMEVDLSLRNPK